MPTGKRASMREGPLAALFRKTAEETPGKDSKDAPGKSSADPGRRSQEGQAQAHPEQRAQAHPEQRAQAHPEQRAQASRARRAQASPGARAQTSSEHQPDAQPSRQAPVPGEPPTLGEQPGQSAAPGQREPQARHVPSPQERLRHAFSADIPENVLEHSAPAAPKDVYARPERTAESLAPPPVERRVGSPVIRVVGVGGAGVNAVNRMVEAEIEGVEFLAINTDLQSLQQCAAHETLHIGDSVTRGLGSGSDPELGRQAAHDEYDRVKALLRGSDMVFIAAGAGGGTGTGAAPIVAQIARDLGALTVAIVTRPFQFEGSRRRVQAEEGIAALGADVDTLIVVPNNRLLSVLHRNVSMVEAFRVADDVLRQGVQGISDLVTLPGLINLDFADVRTIMTGAGTALLGIGMGTGERRAIEAAERAAASPLLETSMEGAHSILLSITGGRDMSLWEVNEAARAVAAAAHPDANIIFGAMLDEKLEDQVWVTVVATGYGDGTRRRGVDQPSFSDSAPDPRPLREPRGEPRVSRTHELPRHSPGELDIPEFIPRR